MQRIAHSEIHLVDRIGWLRAAVLGANDGVISTASLLVGVAAAAATKDAMVIAGVAGLVAGAMSMAAGEYVSVSAQSDTEMAELAKERQELRVYPKAELAELREIYQARGLDHDLAMQVAEQLTAHDALGAHMRDELQITEGTAARPAQAAFVSAASFAIGAALPLLVALLAPGSSVIAWIAIATILSLAALGALGAKVGGANVFPATVRVVFWGALAMAATAAVGAVFGAAL
jgi:VIT1/CCC1 family predicted Fe2+/Mn2+ transporter